MLPLGGERKCIRAVFGDSVLLHLLAAAASSKSWAMSAFVGSVPIQICHF
jgi:hypothetical protein